MKALSFSHEFIPPGSILRVGENKMYSEIYAVTAIAVSSISVVLIALRFKREEKT